VLGSLDAMELIPPTSEHVSEKPKSIVDMN